MREKVQNRPECTFDRPELLPWYAVGTLDPEEAAKVEVHLEDCLLCRDEIRAQDSMQETLALFGRFDPAGHRELEPARPVRSNRWRVAFLAASAAAVALALFAVAGVGRAPSVTPGIQAADSVLLLPSRRGAEGDAVLEGKGPWAVRVILPGAAPDGDYRLEIFDEGARSAGLTETVSADAEGGVSVVVHELDGPGAYRMSLQSLGDPGVKPYEFHFAAAD